MVANEMLKLKDFLTFYTEEEISVAKIQLKSFHVVAGAGFVKLAGFWLSQSQNLVP
jgi:hypothetical protein